MPGYYSDDPNRDFLRWDADRERRLSNRPVCTSCQERIQDDYFYDVSGEAWCEDCLTRFCRKEIDTD